MFPKGGQTRNHCFLAMFPKGGQTRKHCFLAMFPKVGETKKPCFLTMFPEGGQTRKLCFLAMFPEGRHCFLANAFLAPQLPVRLLCHAYGKNAGETIALWKRDCTPRRPGEEYHHHLPGGGVAKDQPKKVEPAVQT